MDTKWKSIDRRAGLKAVCLLLALALTAAAACTGLYALLWGLAFYEQHRGQLGWPYENPEEFLQRELASSSHLASILARYGGEENILAGDGLYWEESTAGRMVTRTAYILYSHLDDGLEWEDDLEYAVVYEEEYVVDGRVNQYSLERRKTREMRDAAHKLRQRHPVFYAGLPEEEQEAFMNGAYLYWAEDHSRFEETTAYEYTLRALYPAGEVHAWVYSDTPLEPDNPRFIAEEQALISRQLADFRYASEWMEGHGAVWYISVRERAGDVQEYGDARLRSYEAAREAFATYMVSNNGEVNGVIEHGEVFRQSYPEPDWGVGRWATVRAAFSSGYVTPLMAGREAAAAQIRELQGRVVATAAPALLMLLGALTLAVAAGLRTARRIGPDGEALFLAPRKVWLDAWLAAMGLGGLLLVLAVDGTSNGWWESVWRFFTGGDFLWALYGLTALAAVLAALPVFLWISALVRRVKAGDWWRHSLIWSVLALAGRALRWLWRGVKALCGALPLALQAAGLLAALAAEIMIVAACFAGRAEGAGVVLFLLFVLADAAFLAMLVIQLRAVEKGAAAAARGEEAGLPAMFSVFGRIGRSLGDLSDGINTAVAERL
ncbi:MAG: hypothetical protein FWG93_08550, partial [Oscillospiraceae bacterium]|nr:hypothetical protein [Oscillospiraceae bacterium]